MAGFSTHIQQELLDHLMTVGSYDGPSAIYVALFTAAPSDTAGSGTECAGTNYTRIAHAGWTAADASSPSGVSNTATVSFPTPGSTTAWGTITHFALFDAATGTANMLAWATLTTAKIISENDTVLFDTGDLTITLD